MRAGARTLGAAWAAVGLAACAVAPRWQDDLQVALSAARAAQQDLVVYFALRGRDASDRMESRLADPAVLAALARGGFAAVACDGSARAMLYKAWIGGGEGMGIAVLDARGVVYAARPGPMDPPELAAFLDLCARSRDALAADRSAAAGASAGAREKLALGVRLLQLGCRTECEPLLLDAATGGLVEARHLLARLYALDGNVVAARRWLSGAPRTPAARVTEGYVLFKERRHAEAVAAFSAALDDRGIGDDRQRALLYLGKSLHEVGDDAKAVPLLEALSREGTGSTFEAAALHTLTHLRDPQHWHAH